MNYYASKVARLKESNISQWWKEVKKIGSLPTSTEWWHQLLDNTNITSADMLADKFNKFLFGLTSHFEPLSVDSHEVTPVPEELFVSTTKVFNALSQIRTNKSPGLDPIPNRVWKEFAFELAPIVKELYNSSLSESYVPDFLKQSLVVPVPKVSPPKLIEEDLRPITLTGQLSKIMEGFTRDSLFRQVRNNLDCKQFSISGKSTTHALVYLMHLILMFLDCSGNYILIFFADFSKGFDLIDHHKLQLVFTRIRIFATRTIRTTRMAVADPVQELRRKPTK